MSVSGREKVAHVVRRLSMGVHPDLVAKHGDVDGAVAGALDLSAPAPTALAMTPPADYQSARNVGEIAQPIAWWLQQMRSESRPIAERLVWFWHDHFATSIAKVRVPYLMYQQHLTLREHATGNFAELLHAVARDPAMLVYLDGITNTAQDRNENFGRECLELFTMGRDGGYTQDDVVAASRAFTGWVVDIPGRVAARALGAATPWSAAFVPRRHDTGVKTLLGKTGAFDMDGALDVILAHPATAKFVARKLYLELVGLEPPPSTLERLAATFRRDYEVMPLVHAIVSDAAFTSDAAVRSKFRTPVEKLVGILQAVPPEQVAVGRLPRRPAADATGVGEALRTMSFLPFLPPNVGGFPKGGRLLGPHNLVHSFDLLAAAGEPPSAKVPVEELFARFGLFDVSDRSRSVVAKEKDPTRRLALVVTSPEYTLT